MKSEHDVRAVADQFQLADEWISAEPFDSDHINDTFRITLSERGARRRYILQRLNHRVFQNPEAVMENIRRVTAHLGKKPPGCPGQNAGCYRLS